MKKLFNTITHSLKIEMFRKQLINKRHLIFSGVFFFFTAFTAFSQNYPMSNATYNGVCSGVFTDSNAGGFTSGGSGNYGNNENYTMTFCSGSSQPMTFIFSELSIKSGDYLKIYDGPNTSSPLLQNITNSSPGSLTITSSGPCITFHFTSDGSGSLFSSNGYWTAGFFCGVINPALAASDNCSNAPTICSFSGYIGNTSSAYTVDQPGNMCQDCNLFEGSLENNSWIRFVADNDTVSFTLQLLSCTDDIGIQFGVYQGTNCNNFVLMTNPSWTSASAPITPGSTSVITATGLTPGNEYYIMIDGNAGDDCIYIINAQSGIQLGATITPSNQTICSGETASISINTSGNPQISWTASPPDPSLAGQQNSTSINVSPSQTTTYSAMYHATSGYCTLDTVFTSVVTVLPPSDPSCNSTITCSISKTDATVCPTPPNYSCNGTATITVSGTAGPFQYLWSDNNTLANRTNLCAGSYTVTVTDPAVSGAVTTCSVSISGPAAPLVSLQAINSCQGVANGSINLTVSGGIPPFQYLWSNGETTEDIANLTSGNYSVTVSDAGSCAALASTTVGSYPPFNVVISPNSPTICAGASTQLTANGGASYLWDGSDIAGNTSASVVVSPTITTTYSVTATSANNCTASTSVTVNIHSQPVLTASANPQAFCTGKSGTIIFTAGGGLGPYTFSVNGNTATSPYSIMPQVSTVYTVAVADACGSVDSENISITVYPLPDIVVEAVPKSGCVPLNVTFSETNNPTALSWKWNFEGKQNIYQGQSLTHLFNNVGLFDVSVKVTSANGCENTLTLEDYIEVFPNPVADFTNTAEKFSTLQPQVEFVNNSIGATEYVWDFGDGSELSSETNPIHEFNIDSKMNFNVCLVAITDKGCSDTLCKMYYCQYEPLVYMPNAFSPNNDGHNETFGPYAWDISKEFYDFTIYNRWGEVVFRTQDFNLRWDGKYNGELCEDGVYVWIIRYKGINTQLSHINGWVKLIR